MVINLDKYKYLFEESEEQRLWRKEWEKKRKLSRIKIWMPSRKKRKKYFNQTR